MSFLTYISQLWSSYIHPQVSFVILCAISKGWVKKNMQAGCLSGTKHHNERKEKKKDKMNISSLTYLFVLSPISMLLPALCNSK